MDLIYNGEKVVIPSFHVDHTMGKGGDSIIPSGSYTMENGGHSKWNIYNGKR